MFAAPCLEFMKGCFQWFGNYVSFRSKNVYIYQDIHIDIYVNKYINSCVRKVMSRKPLKT